MVSAVRTTGTTENQYKPMRYWMTLDSDPVKGPRYFYMEFPKDLPKDERNDILELLAIVKRQLERETD